MADEKKRIISLNEVQSVGDGDFVPVDNAIGGTRKYKLTSILAGASGLTSDIKTALLNCFAHVAWVDANGQTYYDALEDALNDTSIHATGITLSSNSLSFSTLNSTQQLTATLTPAGATDTVTWSSSDTSKATVSATGLVTAKGYGTATITATAGSVSATCSVVVSQATLSSISAVYTQSGTVYDTDSLDSLKSDLVVTAHWSNSTTSTVAAADYTLSGTLTAGTSTITVSYGGKTDTFNVTVSENDTSIINWNFKTSLVDSKQGLEATLGGNATRDSDGVHINSASDFINLGKILGGNQSYEIDIADMNVSSWTSGHGRLFIWYSSNGSGFIYRSTGLWTIYYGAWATPETTYSDKDFFKNSTVKIKTGAASGGNVPVTIYKNGTTLMELTAGNTQAINANNDAYIGGAGSSSAFEMTVTGFRVYSEA